MAQVWYIGPIARLVGDFGADVGFLFVFRFFPPPNLTPTQTPTKLTHTLSLRWATTSASPGPLSCTRRFDTLSSGGLGGERTGVERYARGSERYVDAGMRGRG